MGLLNLAMTMIDPLGIIRKHILYPALEIFSSMVGHYRNKANESVTNVRDLVLRFSIVSFAVAIIIWSAVFMYVAFYYAYMPAITHTRPVHMQFQSCPDKSGPCNFPFAHVALSKKQQLLMVGQSYKVLVNINMPESPENQNLGMFMVCADLRDNSALLRGHSCRSTMLRYKSPLVRIINTWILSPLLMFGVKEENQIIAVELFSNFEEEQSHPVTDVYVEIQSRQIQFYSVSLHITADFTGIRYIMFHWPILSAVLGISTNLFFILIVFTLSWYHWSDTTWIMEAREKYRKLRAKTDLSTTTTTLDDTTNNLLDDDDLSILEEKSSSKSSSDDVEDLSGGSGIENDDGTEKKHKKKLTQTEYGF